MCKAGSQVLIQPGPRGCTLLAQRGQGTEGSAIPGQLGLASDSVACRPLISQEMTS